MPYSIHIVQNNIHSICGENNIEKLIILTFNTIFLITYIFKPLNLKIGLTKETLVKSCFKYKFWFTNFLIGYFKFRFEQNN